ncbi:MAG: caspase family protein [Pirellula sp.]|nr:caspase family protein [Pirellula sp.]
MSRNIYALLVGINDYSQDAGKLSGCLNDFDHFYGYLTQNFDQGRLHIEILKDANATRPNIINQFRSHLGKANADDAVVFHYCGHGARWKSAKPFEQFYPGGMDEGLVCYDSRSSGGFDLADKELAALLAELARNEPYIAVILDCCHSGSATRADDFTLGVEMLNFSSTRGDSENILELTDIQNPEVLKDNPLEVELDINLAQGEMILPLAFDSEFILLIGDPSRDDEGRTHISISDIPEIPDNRRSLGRALKLYFFKTYLKQDNVNHLCWIEYKPDGTFERHRSDVAEKVAAAKNVVLAIHGIIGNTDSIVQGQRIAKAADGNSVDQKFDLVLTYDYENLSTPISETAVKLKDQLAAAGLRKRA